MILTERKSFVKFLERSSLRFLEAFFLLEARAEAEAGGVESVEDSLDDDDDSESELSNEDEESEELDEELGGSGGQQT